MPKDIQTAPSNIPAKKTEESDIIQHRTQAGQSVVLSRQALEAYGAAFVDRIASASGKNRLLMADNHVLEDARKNFPGSATPIVDMYSDYIPDGSDIHLEDRIIPELGRALTEEEAKGIRSKINKNLDSGIQESIKRNSPETMSQPNGDAALIIIPSPESLRDDGFKNRFIESFGLKTDQVGHLPGVSTDWAKFSLYHEVAHINRGHSDISFNNRIKDTTELGGMRSREFLAAENKNILKSEIEADISATRDFNAASGSVPPVPHAFANLRLIRSFLTRSDLLFAGKTYNPDNHNTGNVMMDLENRPASAFDVDKIRFTTDYTNTFVHGLVGVIEKEKNSANLNDPAQLSELGINASYGHPEKIYAATAALFEAGQFDDAPDAKKNAERFIKAIQETTPGLIDRNLVETYRQSLQDPATGTYLEQLHRFNAPDQKNSSTVKPEIQLPPAAAAPAPVQ